MTAAADTWWNGLTPARRDSIHRFLGQQHAHLIAQTETLPFDVDVVSVTATQHRLLRLLRHGPVPYADEGRTVLLHGKRWSKTATIEPLIDAGLLVLVQGFLVAP